MFCGCFVGNIAVLCVGSLRASGGCGGFPLYVEGDSCLYEVRRQRSSHFDPEFVLSHMMQGRLELEYARASDRISTDQSCTS